MILKLDLNQKKYNSHSVKESFNNFISTRKFTLGHCSLKNETLTLSLFDTPDFVSFLSMSDENKFSSYYIRKEILDSLDKQIKNETHLSYSFAHLKQLVESTTLGQASSL